MYEKAVVLEIREDCCLAMLEDSSIVRIQKKPGMREGQKVYILEDDLYRKPDAAKRGAVLPFSVCGRSIRKSTAVKVLTAAAAFLIFLGTVSVPKLADPVYAAVSFDGAKSVQLALDRENHVLDARSYDGTLTEKELSEMEGKPLDQLWETIQSFSEKGEGILVADAPMKRRAESDIDVLEKEIRENLNAENLICLRGGKEDVRAADRQGTSLGLYMLEKAVDEDTLEAQFDDVQAAELALFLETYRDKYPAVYKKFMQYSQDDDDGEDDRDREKDDGAQDREDYDDDDERPGTEGGAVTVPDDDDETEDAPSSEPEDADDEEEQEDLSEDDEAPDQDEED